MHQRIKLVSILVFLVVSLILSAWLIDFSDHMQIWIPIILTGVLGAAVMHVSHIWHSTSTSKVSMKPEDADNPVESRSASTEDKSKVKSLDVRTEPRDIMSEVTEPEDKKTILATEDLLI